MSRARNGVSLAFGALFMVFSSIAWVQTGKVSILCENPRDPTDKRAFEIDYDNKIVTGDRSYQTIGFFPDQIAWQYISGGWSNRFHLERGTGVLFFYCCGEPTTPTARYNCQRVQPGKAF